MSLDEKGVRTSLINFNCSSSGLFVLMFNRTIRRRFCGSYTEVAVSGQHDDHNMRGGTVAETKRLASFLLLSRIYHCRNQRWGYKVNQRSRNRKRVYRLHFFLFSLSLNQSTPIDTTHWIYFISIVHPIDVHRLTYDGKTKYAQIRGYSTYVII